MIRVDKHKVIFGGDIVNLMSEYSLLTENIIREIANQIGQAEAEEFVKKSFFLGVEGSKEDETELLKKKLEEMVDKL